MDGRRTRYAQLAAWTLSLAVAAAALVSWGHDYGWHFWPMDAYVLFPLFGLLAYSIMWSHYANSSLRQVLHLDKKALKSYFEITSFAVLLFICLHPGLLIYQRFRDGAGLPPGSYESYVAPSLKWITLLGSVSLLVFLAYELRRWYRDRSWWKYVVTAGDLAMLAIFYHGLKLGTDLSRGHWFRALWWFYGLSLLGFLAHKYYLRYRHARTEKPAG
jgi:hypothetical protein